MSKLEQFVNNFPWVRNTDTPWAPLNKPLSECTVAMISTGGVYVNGDSPFAIHNSDDVDQSYRSIPSNTPVDKLEIAHEHYNKTYAQQDINVVFPIERLRELADSGFIGQVAHAHFSITGYIPKPDSLYDSGREIAQKLLEMKVDAALIVPV
jgi:D-proline reductase (dithiol) PrdB